MHFSDDDKKSFNVFLPFIRKLFSIGKDDSLVEKVLASFENLVFRTMAYKESALFLLFFLG